MLDFAFPAHSGMRYLVLLIAVMTALYALAGLLRKGPVDKAGLGLLRVFGIVVDIQILLGVLTLLSRPFFPALIGHLVLMIAAVAVVHLGLIRLKKLPPEQRSWGMLLVTTLVTLALMIGGILSIQRPIL